MNSNLSPNKMCLPRSKVVGHLPPGEHRGREGFNHCDMLLMFKYFDNVNYVIQLVIVT